MSRLIPELVYSDLLSEFNLSSALSPINSIWTLDNEGALRVRPGGSPTKVDDHDPDDGGGVLSRYMFMGCMVGAELSSIGLESEE